MNFLNTLAATVLSLLFLQADAQTENSNGLKKATLVLADGSNLSGQVKDNIRKKASVVFTADDGKKTTYDGSSLTSAEIEGVKFICIKGDFFKVFCEGELCFLQKASDASGKPTYNGNEAVFSSGTEGKPGDYFIYNSSGKQLQLISKKNLAEVTSKTFAGNTAAIDKAKTIDGDLSQLKDAVEIYNNRNRGVN